MSRYFFPCLGYHSVILFVQWLSVYTTMWPAQCYLLLLTATIMSSTLVCFLIQVFIFWFLLMNSNMYPSILFWVVTNFYSIFFVRIYVSQPYVITGGMHILKGFLLSISISYCPLGSYSIGCIHTIPIASYIEFLLSVFFVLWLLVLSTCILPHFQLSSLLSSLIVGLLLYWTLPLSSYSYLQSYFLYLLLSLFFLSITFCDHLIFLVLFIQYLNEQYYVVCRSQMVEILSIDICVLNHLFV